MILNEEIGRERIIRKIETTHTFLSLFTSMNVDYDEFEIEPANRKRVRIYPSISFYKPKLKKGDHPGSFTNIGDIHIMKKNGLQVKNNKAVAFGLFLGEEYASGAPLFIASLESPLFVHHWGATIRDRQLNFMVET